MGEKFIKVIEIETVKVNCGECGSELLLAVDEDNNLTPVVYCETCYEELKEAKESCESKMEEIHELATNLP